MLRSSSVKLEHALTTRPAVRVRGGQAAAETCAVPMEAPLTITVDGLGVYTLMCTPTQTAALAVGFALSEGLISALRDIDLCYHCEDDPGAVRLRLNRATDAAPRTLIVSSACGLCGTQDLDALVAGLPHLPSTLALPSAALLAAQAAMRAAQPIFARTGGTHAAALCTADGTLVACAEDIGRHNALDKCLGLCLLAERPTAGLAAVLSGRLSLEMVVKAARAGVEVLAAVSAPTALAIDAADRCGLTLCAFVRDDRVTAFTHPARIPDATP